ncbi:MAG: hypothetical protein AAF098_16655 [Pseudomonadota bacterium]
MRLNYKNIFRGIAVFGALLCLTFESQGAARVVGPAKITRLLTTDNINFGNCMALLDGTGQAALQAISGCNDQFVSFGCAAADEIGLSRSEAQAHWAAAQLAFVTGGRVRLVIQDNLRYGQNPGYCVVTEIQNLPN